MKTRIDLKNKNIVIIYMLYFGDTIALTPFLAALRKEAVGSKITLVMDGNFHDALKYSPDVDEIIPVNRKKLCLSGTLKLGREIGKTHPDILFTLHGTSRTTLMGLAMHPKLWVGKKGTRLDHFWMDCELKMYSPEKHCTIGYLDALRQITENTIPPYMMTTYSCPGWDASVEKFFAKHGVKKGDKLAGYSVGSTLLEKDWPAERFGEVAAHFAKLGYRPVFFGVERERPLVEAAVKQLDCDPIIAINKLSMGEFIAAASWCSVAFTNDSGPLYVFDSRGVPTVSLFGPSSARNHYPMGPHSVALTSTDMPIGQDHVHHTIRDGNYTPIDRIPMKEVIQAGEWALGIRNDKKYESHFLFVV